MSERYDDLMDEIFEEIDVERKDYVTALYVPQNRVDLAQAFDIPFEREAFKRVIGGDFFDLPIIPRKVLIFLSKENEGYEEERFNLKDLADKIKGDAIIVMGDERYVEDLDELSAFFYERNINVIMHGEEDEEDEDKEITEDDINPLEEETVSENTEITVDAKGAGT